MLSLTHCMILIRPRPPLKLCSSCALVSFLAFVHLGQREWWKEKKCAWLSFAVIQMWWFCAGRGNWEACFGGLELKLGDKWRATGPRSRTGSASTMTPLVMLSTLIMAISGFSVNHHCLLEISTTRWMN